MINVLVLLATVLAAPQAGGAAPLPDAGAAATGAKTLAPLPDAGAAATGAKTLADRLAGPAAPDTAELRAWGANVDLALIDLARKQSAATATRRAAIAALGKLATRTALDYLARVVSGAGDAKAEQDLALVRAAAFALAWTRDAQTVDRLLPLLTHRNREVRLDAVAALAATRLPEAADLLASYIAAEKDPDLRQKARKQLRVLERTVGRPPPPPPPPPPRVNRPRSIHERTEPSRPPERDL